MKQFFTIVLTAGLLGLGSCSKDFLELAPISNANAGNFYQSEQDFELAINGAYKSLTLEGVYHDFFQLVGDLRSDNTEMGTTAGSRTTFQEMHEFRDQSTSNIVSGIWNDHYNGIAQCNRILDKIQGVEFTAAKKSRITGEAYFLRALLYFNLVRAFGDMPLIREDLTDIGKAYAAGRTPVGEVYNAIIEDLRQAAGLLSPSYTGANIGRATAGAANSLLGKVYLTIHRSSDAVPVLREVINSKQYNLLASFDDLWKPANGNNKESVFEVQFLQAAGASTGSFFSIRYTPYLSNFLGISTTGGGYNIPTADLLNAYSAADKRKNSSVAAGYTNAGGSYVSGLEGRHTRKFLGTPNVESGANDNWPVLRYADVLLLYAEALNEAGWVADGDAFFYLNEVRGRAGLDSYSSTATDPTLRISSQEDFRLAIEKERRLELACEGHRWFDLVRTGRAKTVLAEKGMNILDHQLLLPIPQQQIDINPEKIIQNKDY
ncbi:MAG: RagB/SusD family nutrient uptake outer membrane protein [Candidatus Pseudobacter hemicellulosilyticus]|uniref:RagB/SusD family nutrient uptake outer membrane protein n=1 Tax=Candidatus Pseudobacter hemicellulosilyticus TaxID=3121375 RepID=A0AAJ5WP05_9BACT|nr:MAG: RagB/SusD family nutrient uptake outer membrane protein [Pseudobacter sp.]